MALNIVAHRRASLKGFGEGWDDCYVTVRAMNQTQRDDYLSSLDSVSTGEELLGALQLIATEVIIGGVVINTKDDGTTEKISFGEDDKLAVIQALGSAWLQEVIGVASGADRLKART